jgi:hypothetical protein
LEESTAIMDSTLPTCPRCPDGGQMILASQDEDATVFSPPPGRQRSAQIYQCSVCGWAIVQNPPSEKTGDR